jgi:hypothetical protein
LEAELCVAQQSVGHRRNKKRGNKKFREFNESENTTYQDLWDKENTVLRGKFIAIRAYIKKGQKVPK